MGCERRVVYDIINVINGEVTLKQALIKDKQCDNCGSRELLSVDHLIPTKQGGENSGDNLVWACRSCNSSKGAIDALEWQAEKNQFPPILQAYVAHTADGASLSAQLVTEASGRANFQDRGDCASPQEPQKLVDDMGLR